MGWFGAFDLLYLKPYPNTWYEYNGPTILFNDSWCLRTSLNETHKHMIYCTHTDVTRTNNNIYDLQNCKYDDIQMISSMLKWNTGYIRSDRVQGMEAKLSYMSLE